MSVHPRLPAHAKTLGGLLSTGTHGTGVKFGIVASTVLGLDIMLASGEVVNCSRSDNVELFLAALCSLGLFASILSC